MARRAPLGADAASRRSLWVGAFGLSLFVAAALSSSATASRNAPSVKVAFIQGEQVVYVDRPGSSVKDAVIALLAGPTNVERTHDVRSQIPAATPLRSLTVKDRLATVDLGEKFAAGTRAESLTARVAQVVLTVTRDPKVRLVQLRVKGGTPLGLFPGVVTRHPLSAKDVLAPDQPPPSAPAPLPPGSPSAETRALQQRLADLGFLNVDEVDGRAGPRTTSAVVAFQKWAALARDGAAGAATRTALGKFQSADANRKR